MAERAEGVIEISAASTEAMEELRQKLVVFCTQAVNQKALAAAKVTPVFSRLQALGPAPAEGETEALDVAVLRKELKRPAEKPACACDCGGGIVQPCGWVDQTD